MGIESLSIVQSLSQQISLFEPQLFSTSSLNTRMLTDENTSQLIERNGLRIDSKDLLMLDEAYLKRLSDEIWAKTDTLARDTGRELHMDTLLLRGNRESLLSHEYKHIHTAIELEGVENLSLNDICVWIAWGLDEDKIDLILAANFPNSLIRSIPSVLLAPDSPEVSDYHQLHSFLLRNYRSFNIDDLKRIVRIANSKPTYNKRAWQIQRDFLAFWGIYFWKK